MITINNANIPVVKQIDLLSGQQFDKATYRRHDAFRTGKNYDHKAVLLTERRLIQSGLVSNTFFTYECHDEAFVLKHSNSHALPRTLKFGFGINTEGLLVLKGSYQNVGLDRKGSTFYLGSELSFIQQQAETYIKIPYRADSSASLKPKLELIRHSSEREEN